jgi:hypothetical protein
MNCYYDLELLADDHVRRRRAEADHERLVRQAQLVSAVAPRGLWARLRALRWLLPSRPVFAPVPHAKETIG